MIEIFRYLRHVGEIELSDHKLRLWDGCGRGAARRFLLPLRCALDVAGALPCAEFVGVAGVFVVHDGVEVVDARNLAR